MTSPNPGEVLHQFLMDDPKGRSCLIVPEGRYKGWVPRALYEMTCTNVSLPFLKLISFPVGGCSLGQLVHMETFSAVGNYLTRLPDSFAQCQNLVSLDLSYNNLEKIPGPVFRLANLVELILSENDISELSPAVGDLRKLNKLNLSGNLLDSLPIELTRCSKLEYLDLSRKWFPRGGFEVLPSAVCSLTQLTYLDVSWHAITVIAEDIRNITRIRTLRMKGNFLKYVAQEVADCRQLQVLDLTGAMKLNSVIPSEIFTMPELQTLDITNNYFAEIAPEIVGLKTLQTLTVRRNALVRIPDEVFHMESLVSIDFSENYLEEIPSSVSGLKTLQSLFLSHNKIRKLPDEICNCTNLRCLYLHSNELQSLPKNIHKLEHLEELLLDGNQLVTLPLMFDKLELLAQTRCLSLHNNKLRVPPQEICDQGIQNIYAFLKEYRVEKATHRQKLILIGASMAGKTSLRNALITGKSKLTRREERTWVMERHLWEPEPDMRVQILDLGGHHIYSAAHHMFLTPEALHVLVFDLSVYAEEAYDEMVGDWLDSIMDRAPGATIMLVGTHADLCNQDEIIEKRDHILGRMHSEENAKLRDLQHQIELEKNNLTKEQKESGQKFPDLDIQRLQEKVNSMIKLKETRIQLPHKIYGVSCAEKLEGISIFQGELIDSLRWSDARSVPDSYFKFLARIQERTDMILTWDDTCIILDDMVKSLNISYSSLAGSRDGSLQVLLQYLHVTGEIVWYHDNPRLREIVFHHPETLVEMLRAIFRHDFEEVVNYVESYGRHAGITKDRFESLKVAFLHKGLMTSELLNFCLQHFNLGFQSCDIFIDLMLKFDLCYQVVDATSAPEVIGSERVLLFPWFLSSTPIEDLDTKWTKQVPDNQIELRYQLQFLKKGLPNFFEKLSARLQSVVTQREDWKDGILAGRNRCKLLLRRNKNDGLSCITLSVRGAPEDLLDLWFLILNINGSMLALLKEWPLVKVDRYMVCPNSILTGQPKPYLWRGEILNMKCPKGLYQVECPLTKSPIPACLVYPLDPEFTQNDVEKHIRFVIEFLRNISDTQDGPGPTGPLSDQGLRRIAVKLGAEWKTVAIELGLWQAAIEQILTGNPHERTEQHILLALIKWRDEISRETDDASRINELLAAITSAGRADLVQDLREQLL